MPSKNRSVGFNEIQSKLIEGGYFRARIQSLTQFDVVAGGLAWGILHSRFSIDVEFVENAIIRDKIKVAENICKALRGGEMNCPHPLEPHQIQGLDYPSIDTVLTWLLKRVAAAREEYANFVRDFTKQEYKRRFGCALPRKLMMDNESRGRVNILGLDLRQPLKRSFISNKENYCDAVEHVSAVLLEYGVQYQLRDSMLMVARKDEFEGDLEAQREHHKMEDEERKEEAMYENLASQMMQFKEKQRLTANHLSNVVAATDADKLAKLRESYKARHSQLQQRIANEEKERNVLSKQKERILHSKKQLANYEGKISDIHSEIESLQVEYDQKEKEIQDKDDCVDVDEKRVEEVEKVIRGDVTRSKQLDELIALLAAKENELAELKNDKAESKKQITEVKANCQELADKLEVLKTEGASEQLSTELSKYQNAHEELNAQLNEATYQSMDLLRRIDQYPTRLELQQYERRMDELNEEVAWKFEETRLMYSKHNTKAEIAKCIGSEETMFASIIDAINLCLNDGAKKSSDRRAALLDQISHVNSQIIDSLKKQLEKLKTDQDQLCQLRRDYSELIATQKQYGTLLANFKTLMTDVCVKINQLRELDHTSADEFEGTMKGGGGNVAEESDVL